MISVIAGSAGTGKTFSALDWAAQKPGTFFIAGDEDIFTLRSKSEAFSKDNSKTIFFEVSLDDPDFLALLRRGLETGGRRIVIDGVDRFQDLNGKVLPEIVDLCAEFPGVEILLTMQTRRAAVQNPQKALGEVPSALFEATETFVLLDAPYGTSPSGLLVKDRGTISADGSFAGIQLRLDTPAALPF